MARPYGKTPRKTRSSSRTKKPDSEAFKIKLRGKDNAPLSMREMQQGLYEIARRLKAHDACRVAALSSGSLLVSSASCWQSLFLVAASLGTRSLMHCGFSRRC
jgi:hypothetical protein